MEQVRIRNLAERVVKIMYPELKGRIKLGTIAEAEECITEFLQEVSQESKPDNINHPSHYTSHPSKVECIDIVEHFNFSIGNAIKYLWRAGLKGDRLEDLKKARWYVEREIGRVEKEMNKDNRKDGE